MGHILALLIIALCFLFLSVGVIFTGKKMRAGCGDPDGGNGSETDEGCGACPSRRAKICESEPEGEIVRLSRLGYPRKKE